MLPKTVRKGKHVVTVKVPWSTLVLLPHDEFFVHVSILQCVKKGSRGVVIDLPTGTVIRVGAKPNAKYYLVDSKEGLVELEGKRAKMLWVNIWGWHYHDPRTGERIVSVIYDGRRFRRFIHKPR